MNPMGFAAISQTWWSAIGAPLANHLWQSTLFAGAVGLLTLLLRKNHARARHSLWLVASLKFLIPFSLLVAAGSHFGWFRSPARPQTELILVIQDFSQPFAAAGTIHHIAPTAAPSVPLATRALPILLLLAWSLGFAAVLLYWWRRSRRIAAAIQSAQPVGCGREIALLRDLERSLGITRQTQLIYSNSALEPGIVGIFRSVLLLPAGISDRLTDAQLQSVLTHEICHARRRDNLAAALHMLVEALFWFHPLVWWLGTRLLDERERACDEEVLRLGSDPQTYAESILKICEFYLESPLVCVPGVTGSNLKKRIEAIMRNQAPLNLNFPRKLLLSSAACLAVVTPVVFGLFYAAQTRAQSRAPVTSGSTFASVYLQPNTTGEPMPPFVVHGRPMKAVQFKGGDNFLATNFTLRDLLKVAFDVLPEQIEGGPSWMDSDKFDVNAKLSSTELQNRQQLTPDQKTKDLRNRLQAMLEDRFKLAFHRESKSIAIYALVVAPGGAKLQLAKPGDTYPNGPQLPNGKPITGLLSPKNGEWVAQALSISSFASSLSSKNLGRSVVDKTGLSGNYDFTLHWTPDPSSASPNASIFPALEQQLGLKLEAQDMPAEIIVVDHAEKLTVAGQIDDSAIENTGPQLSNLDSPESPFESVSIRLDRDAPGAMHFGWFAPDTFTTSGSTLNELIQEAYGVQSGQIMGAPLWAGSNRYNVKAKFTESELALVKRLDRDSGNQECLRTLQRLLAEHFNLVLHGEKRLVPAYVLQVAASGSKLHVATPGDTYPSGIKDLNGMGHANVIHFGPGEFIGQGVPISDLVTLLAMQHVDRVIADNTELSGKFDFTLQWTPTSFSGGAPDPALRKAMETQLGLTLEARDATIPVLVVNQAEQPAAE